MSKPRSDSPLRNLPEQRQEQIIEWCNTPKSDKCVGGYAFAKQQLAADGLKASQGALSDFYSWWHLRRDFQRQDSLTRDFEEMLRKEFPSADPKKIQEFGQAFFTMQAAARRDPKEFREMEYLRLSKETAATKGRHKEKELELSERRVVILEGKISKAKEKLTKVAAKGGLSAEALKQIESAAKILS
jgi:hypothetical protein